MFQAVSKIFITATLVAVLASTALTGCASGQEAEGSPDGQPGAIAERAGLAARAAYIRPWDAQRINLRDLSPEVVGSGIGTDPGFAYPVNDSGQTYGGWGMVDEELLLSGCLPDLIAIMIEDGRLGYVYREDYICYSRKFIPLHSEQAELSMEYDMQTVIDGFCDYYVIATGQEADRKEVTELYRSIQRISGMMVYAVNWNLLNDDLKAMVVDFFPEGYRSMQVAEEAWTAGYNAKAVPIAVYQVDGETQIGVTYLHYYPDGWVGPPK